jgi:hypothetical protein
MIIDGFEKAIIGVEHQTNRIVYDKNAMVKILVKNKMEIMDAIEYLQHNVWDSYNGQDTPIYIERLTIKELI